MSKIFVLVLIASVTLCNVNGHKGGKNGGENGSEKGGKENCMKTSFDLMKCCKVPQPEKNEMDKECMDKYKDDKKAGMMMVLFSFLCKTITNESFIKSVHARVCI